MKKEVDLLREKQSSFRSTELLIPLNPLPICLSDERILDLTGHLISTVDYGERTRLMTSEEKAPPRSWQEKEDATLVEAGFEQDEESGLWGKSGILFGRGAALQQAMLELSKS